MEYKERYRIILVLFFLGSGVLIANLFDHQVIDSDYSLRAENRTLVKKTIRPSRGVIVDRNDKLMVVNEPTYQLEIIYNEILPDFDRARFCELLNIEPVEYDQALEIVRGRRYFHKHLPITLLDNISPLIYSQFQEHLHKFPGFYPVIKSRRSYPYAAAGHVLGYVNEVNPREIASYDQYEIGDTKGANGLEGYYDAELRGVKGVEYLLKDNFGKELEKYEYGDNDSTAQSGLRLTSSIDIDLQVYAETLLQNKRGSIVAIEPKTGEILTMASSPGYDPNLLSFGKERSDTYLSLLSDTLQRPLLDRSVQTKYPPGSIFKPILGLIAMQEGITYPTKSMHCSGEYVINEKKGFIQGCRDHPHPYNLQTALQYSCNTYFYQMMRDFINHYGYRTPGKGLDLLNEYLERFGLGSKLGMDLREEIDGFIPTTSYYNEQYKCDQCWRSTYILSLGIGQGELQLTTVQMANLAAIIANRGYYYIPHLIRDVSNRPIENKYREKQSVGVDSIIFEPVIEGMEKVVSAGSGFRASSKGISIAGKTGTSQNPQGVDHSVFFAFAPVEDPKIAVAVFIENAGGGGTYAAPISGLLIEKYINKEISKRRLPVEQSILAADLITLQ
jgi:penicillin-binding protein 2